MGHKTSTITVVFDEDGFMLGRVVTSGGDVVEFEEDGLELTLAELLGLDSDEDDDFQFGLDDNPLSEEWVEAVLSDEEDTDHKVVTAEFPIDEVEEDEIPF